MSPVFYYDMDSLKGLDTNLEQPSVKNFVEALHRRMRKHKVEDLSTLLDPKGCLIFGPKGTLQGLKNAVECGIADNYTFHFAFTLLLLYRELEKIDPDLLSRIKATSKSSPEWLESFQSYCKDLSEDPTPTVSK